MKKIISLTLAAAMLLCVLTACRMPEREDPFKEILEENPEMELPKSEIMEIDPEDIPQQELPEIEPSASDVDVIETEAGEIAIKHKIFEYNDHNLVVMRVENHSDQDLTLTIRGTCEDIGGQSMTITKKFEGFAANWQNYVLFYPEFSFDHFEYEIEYEAFTGEAYSQYIFNLEYDGLWLTPKYYYDGRPYNVVMHGGWTFDYEHNQSAWFAAEYVYFKADGEEDIFEMDEVVLLDFVCEDGIAPLKPEHGTYQNILDRTLGTDRNTLWDSVGFSYDNSLGEACIYFPEYDCAEPYTAPAPFNDMQGLLCWNAIGKSGTQPALGSTEYFPTWAMDQWVPPPGA